MKPIRLTLLVSAPALLAGCMAMPVAPDYYGGAYDPYASPPVYYTPMPLYVSPLYISPPVYHRRPIGGKGHGGKGGHGHGHGHGHH